jgi:hypothetical protein
MMGLSFLPISVWRGLLFVLSSEVRWKVDLEFCFEHPWTVARLNAHDAGNRNFAKFGLVLALLAYPLYKRDLGGKETKKYSKPPFPDVSRELRKKQTLSQKGAFE